MRLYLVACLFAAVGYASAADFKVLAFYSMNVEPDHQAFARDANSFFSNLAQQRNFVYDSTEDWGQHRDDVLNNYDVVIWLNNALWDGNQRKAFENYMESGGAWFGFHVAGYNDGNTNWPWFVNLFGGGHHNNNNWPPLPAKLIVDNRRSYEHPVTKRLPEKFTSPSNEWYQWVPSPRENQDIQVLLTLDPANYPLGQKNILDGGDIPVVWTSKKYHYVYMNQGHGDQIFKDQDQNNMIEDAVVWLGNLAKQRRN